MATISKLQPKQTLYTRVRRKMGNTTMSRTELQYVVVEEVDAAGQWVTARVGNGPVRTYRQDTVKKWLVTKPAPKSTRGGLPHY